MNFRCSLCLDSQLNVCHLPRQLKIVYRKPTAVNRSIRRANRRLPRTNATGFDPTHISQDNILAAGAAAAAVLAGGVAWFSQQQQSDQRDSMGASTSAPARQDAVVVVGASGKTGRLVIEELLKAGRTVVAASRDVAAAKATLRDAGLSGHQQLSFESIDITEPASVAESMWAGTSQVVLAVGPTFQRQSTGTGNLRQNSSQQVDAQGVKNIVDALKSKFPQQERVERQQVIPLQSEHDVNKFDRLDDVIMGGQSQSGLRMGTDGTAVWEGVLRVEGGGFCGTCARGLRLDLNRFDGMSLKVLGDGQTFKVNLKTADQDNFPESTYQTTFDTTEGEWTTVDLPWRQFVPVKRASVDESARALDPKAITQFGLVLSRFDFNGLPNSHYKPGNFSLQIKGGISAFIAPRPRIVLISSAGTERNARIGNDEAARKKDIPIVQLNPGGVLNYKYDGETSVRSSGLAYTVLRPTGLSSDKELMPRALELSQGDRISGKVLRQEVATVVVAALSSPAAVGKTVEIRRSEASDASTDAPTVPQLQRQLLTLAEDRHRPRIGLPYLPKPSAPPPPPSKERTEEILADPRVQTAANRNQSNAKPLAPNGSSNSNGIAASSQNGTAQGENGKLPNAKDAQQWIEAWKEKQPTGR